MEAMKNPTTRSLKYRARGTHLYTLLVYCARSVRLSGTYTSVKQSYSSGATPTSAKALQAMREQQPVEASDHEAAAAALAYAAGLGSSASDFEQKLAALARKDTVTQREIGAAAYIIEAAPASARRAAKTAAREAERVELKARTAESAYLGKKGERLTWEDCEVLMVKGFRGYYGYSEIVKLVTPEGDVIVTFTSGDHGLKPGDRAAIKGTVKKHERYDGIAQTSVSRMTVVSKEEPAAPRLKVVPPVAEEPAPVAEEPAVIEWPAEEAAPECGGAYSPSALMADSMEFDF